MDSRSDAADRMYALEKENIELKRKNNSLVKALKKMTVQHNRLKHEALQAGGGKVDHDADEVIARLTREKGRLVRDVRALEDEVAKYKRLAQRAGRGGGGRRRGAWEAPAAATGVNMRSSTAEIYNESMQRGGAGASMAGFDQLMQGLVTAERSGAGARNVAPLLGQVRARLVATEQTTVRLKQEKEALAQRVRVLETQLRAAKNGHGGGRQQVDHSGALTQRGSSGGVGDELFRRERELKDTKIKLMMLEAKLDRATSVLQSERQLHSRTHASLDEFNAQIRDLQHKLQQSQAEGARAKAQLDRLKDADEELRTVKDENRVLQERLDKLWNMPLMSQSVKTVDRSDRLAELQQQATQAKDDLAYLRKELHKKHEEKEHAVKEARRLAEENRALKEEKQQLVAMGAEASRGTNLLQQQLALYGGRADSAGVPPDELLRALGIVRRRLDNPSRVGGDSEDPEEQVVVLRRRLEKVQVGHREAQLELDRSKAMLKRYHDICARQQEDIAELTQQETNSRANVQRRLREVNHLAESRRRRIQHLEALNAKLRGQATAAPRLMDAKGRGRGRGNDADTVASGDDSLWSDAAALGPLENLVQVFVADARLRREVILDAGGDADSLTTVAMVEFINFAPMMSPAATGGEPAFNYMVKFPVAPDHTLLRYLATNVVTVELHRMVHADFELVGRATLPLRGLLQGRGSVTFENAPLVMEGADLNEVGSVTVKVRMAVPVSGLWRAFLQSHPAEAAELDDAMVEQDAADAARVASRAAREINTLEVAIESCSALVTADGATPSAYVYYQLDSRSSALSFGDYMTRVVDAPPTADPVFDEVFAHELPPTVEVLDTLAQEPLMVMVFDASASSRDPSAPSGRQGALIGSASVSLAPVAEGQPLHGTFDLYDKHSVPAGRVTLKVSWEKPLVPVDPTPDNHLTLPQFNAFATRFDRGGTIPDGAAAAGDPAATIAYQPLMRSLTLSHHQHRAIQQLRAACAAADSKARLEGGVGETGSGWEEAIVRCGQNRGKLHGKATARELFQTLQAHGVDVGFPLVSDVATSLEEEGGDGALDGDNAFVQTADFLYLCRPTTRNAAIAEGKLSRHIKTLRSERVEPMAAFGVFDRHGLGFISRHDLKRALQSLQVKFTDDYAAVPDPRAADDWEEPGNRLRDRPGRHRHRHRRADDDSVGAGQLQDDAVGDGAEEVVLRPQHAARGHGRDSDADARFEKGMRGPAAGARATAARARGEDGALNDGTEERNPYKGAPPRRPGGASGGSRRPAGARAGARGRPAAVDTGAGGGAGAGVGASGGASRGGRQLFSPRDNEYMAWDEVDALRGEMDSDFKDSAAAVESALKDWAGSMESKGQDPHTSMKRAFLAMDTDNSGTLDANEIAQAIESMGVHVDKAAVLAFVDDYGSNGTVTLQQFTQFALYQPKSVSGIMGTLRKAFAGRSVTEAMRYFDKNRDGVMSRREFAQGLSQMKLNLTGKEMAELVRTLDVRMDGTIDVAMFQEMILDVREYQAPDASFRLSSFEEELRRTIKVARQNSGLSLQKLFSTFDTNHDGEVTRDEFRSVINQLAEASPEKKLRMGEGDLFRLFRRFDWRDTGTIQYEDFVQFVQGGDNQDGSRSPARARKSLRRGRGSGVNLKTAQQKMYNTLCQQPTAVGLLEDSFRNADPADRGLVQVVMFSSVLEASGVPLVRSEVAALGKKFRKSARESRLVRWRDFMAWATPELLKKGSGEAAVASAVEDRLRQTLRAYADRHGGRVDYRDIFREFDTSNNGSIATRDFFAKLAELGFDNLDHTHRFFLLSKFDSNHDGYIGLDEFTRFAESLGGVSTGAGGDVSRDSKELLAKLRRVLRQAQRSGTSVRELFDTLQEEGGSTTTSMSYAEFARGLRGIGFKATPDELRAMAQQFDADHGGRVEYQEFLAMVRGTAKSSSGATAGTASSTYDRTVRNRERLLRLVKARMVQDHANARTVFANVFCEPGRTSATAASFADGVAQLGMQISTSASKRLLSKLARNSPEGRLSEGDFCLFVQQPDYEDFEYALRAKVLLAAAKGKPMLANQIMGDMDLEASGKLSKSQFAKAVRQLGLDLSDQEMSALATRYGDPDGTYVLYREFVPFVDAVVSRYDKVKDLLGRVRHAVELYIPPTDADERARRGGTIEGAGGMTPRSKSKSSKSSAQQRVFAELDPDGTGSVDYEKFEKGLRQLGVRLDASEMRQLAEALDWDNDRQVGYMEFVQLMQAEAVEAVHHRHDAGAAGAESKRPADVDDSKAPDDGAPSTSGVVSFQGTMRGVGPDESVSVSVSSCKITLGLTKARKIKKVAVTYSFLDDREQRVEGSVNSMKTAVFSNGTTTFVTRRGTPGGDLFKDMLRAMQRRPQRGEIVFKLFNVTSAARPVELGKAVFNMNAVLEHSKDITHETITMADRRGDKVAQLSIGVRAWKVVEALVDEIM